MCSCLAAEPEEKIEKQTTDDSTSVLLRKRKALSDPLERSKTNSGKALYTPVALQPSTLLTEQDKSMQFNKECNLMCMCTTSSKIVMLSYTHMRTILCLSHEDAAVLSLSFELSSIKISHADLANSNLAL